MIDLMVIENKDDIVFSENTPKILEEVLIDCIERGVKVHILTGDPITGVVVPNLVSVGTLVLSSGKKPSPMFKADVFYTPEGLRAEATATKMVWLKTDRILKINEVDSGVLLYQSYECQSSPLKFITELKVSPYGDKTSKAKIVCTNPEIEITVPNDVDPEMLCRFLFGQVHYLPDCINRLMES